MLTNEQLKNTFIRYSEEITEELFNKILERAKECDDTKPYDFVPNTFTEFKRHGYFWFGRGGFSYGVDNNSIGCQEITISDILGDNYKTYPIPKNQLEQYDDEGNLIETSLFDVNDWVCIIDRPALWASLLNNNNPLLADIKYPYICQIKNLKWDDNYMAMTCGKYGWNLSYLIDSKLIRIATPEEISSVQDKAIISAYGLKVGDKLPAVVITKWARQGLNYVSTKYPKWCMQEPYFVNDRTIKTFELIDGQIGFEVSNTSTAWLKAKGFKEFMESFDKPEKVEESTINRIPVGSKVLYKGEEVTLIGYHIKDNLVMIEGWANGHSGSFTEYYHDENLNPIYLSPSSKMDRYYVPYDEITPISKTQSKSKDKYDNIDTSLRFWLEDNVRLNDLSIEELPNKINTKEIISYGLWKLIPGELSKDKAEWCKEYWNSLTPIKVGKGILEQVQQFEPVELNDELSREVVVPKVQEKITLKKFNVPRI